MKDVEYTRHYNQYKADCIDASFKNLENGELPLWMYPNCYWTFYGELLYKAKSYAEFAMLSVLKGYVNPDASRRHDETLNLAYRYEPYEEFIYQESSSHRGSGKMNAKALKFRDELIETEKKNGERDKESIIIPTRYEMQTSKRTREWCHKYHPDYFKLRGIEDDIS